MRYPGWEIETIDPTVYWGASMVIDDAGNTHISFFNDDLKELKFASQDSTGMWSIQTVDSEFDVMSYPSQTSLAQDQAGNFHISYIESGFPSSELRYATGDGELWQISTIDALGGGFSSIDVDQFGRPHISYHDQALEDLKHAYIPAPEYELTVKTTRYSAYTLPGSTITYTIGIANSGLNADTYTLEVSNNLWEINTSQQIVPLSKYEWIDVNIQVTIPHTATLGSSDTATITLTSQNDPSISASATLTTYAAITTYLPLVAR
jgi:hypothetical protein